MSVSIGRCRRVEKSVRLLVTRRIQRIGNWLLLSEDSQDWSLGSEDPAAQFYVEPGVQLNVPPVCAAHELFEVEEVMALHEREQDKGSPPFLP